MSYDILSDEIKIKIQSYLDYESIINLSQTNKLNNVLYKNICKNECNKYDEFILLYSTKNYYINTEYKLVDRIFASFLFTQIVSYNCEFVTYKYISYGNYNNYTYPISNFILYIFTHDINKPPYVKHIMVSRNIFDKSYKLYKEIPFYKNKILLTKFIINSLCFYIFMYVPFIILFCVLYMFYYIFYIIFIMFYVFGLIITYELSIMFFNYIFR